AIGLPAHALHAGVPGSGQRRHARPLRTGFPASPAHRLVRAVGRPPLYACRAPPGAAPALARLPVRLFPPLVPALPACPLHRRGLVRAVHPAGPCSLVAPSTCAAFLSARRGVPGAGLPLPPAHPGDRAGPGALARGGEARTSHPPLATGPGLPGDGARGPGAGFLVLRPARGHRLELPADRDHRGFPAPLHGVPLVVLLCLGGEIRDPSLRHSAPAGLRPGLRAAPPAFPGVDHRALFGDAHADPAQGPALPVPAGGPDAPAVGDGRTAGPGPIPPSGAVVAPP